MGTNAADYLYGRDGNDVLLGKGGNDYIYSDNGNGNDTLNGGADNDQLYGGTGKLNVLQFKAGVTASEVVATRSGTDLVLSIAGTPDEVTIGYFFSDDPANAYNAIQQVKFADGTSWDVNALKDKAFAGTTAADVINGQAGADYIYGGAGNDTYVCGQCRGCRYGERQ